MVNCRSFGTARIIWNANVILHYRHYVHRRQFYSIIIGLKLLFLRRVRQADPADDDDRHVVNRAAGQGLIG